MTDGPQKKGSKDGWDKADVVGKFISGALLAVIALLIKFGADNIAASLEAGNLVQSLLADLTSQDAKVKQDLALIALDHAVGDQKPQLIADIAERIYRDLIESHGPIITDDKVAFGSIAFQILEKRDGERANKLRSDMKGPAAAERQLKPATTAGAFSADMKGQGPTTEPAGRARLLARIFPNMVYIHFDDNARREDVKKMREHIEKSGYFAPGVEYVEVKEVKKAYGNEVRYFYPEDQEQAGKLIALLDAYFEGKKQEGMPRKGGKFSAKDLSGRGYRAARGLLEVWVDYIDDQPKEKKG